MDVVAEGRLLVDALEELLGTWDGRDAIKAMHRHEVRGWRDNEWFGFYFEWRAIELLSGRFGGVRGPTIGNTTIDYMLEYPWDLKAHVLKTTQSSKAWLNDVEAVKTAVEDFGACGFLICVGTAEMDSSGAFASWHRKYKGGLSKYTRERIARGAPSRARKAAFVAEAITGFCLSSGDAITRALSEGWLSDRAQKGMRNSDGSPRRAKYEVNVKAIPDWARLGSWSP